MAGDPALATAVSWLGEVVLEGNKVRFNFNFNFCVRFVCDFTASLAMTVSWLGEVVLEGQQGEIQLQLMSSPVCICKVHNRYMYAAYTTCLSSALAGQVAHCNRQVLSRHRALLVCTHTRLTMNARQRTRPPRAPQ
jgi:hypothetical protein